jgi:predicted nucleotidyltransferase
MDTLLRDRISELSDLCRRHHVRRLEVFGSAAREGGFDPGSGDLDFLVEFKPLSKGQHADAYFGLLEDLEVLFDRHVDLVMERAVKNPYFLDDIKPTRVVLYAD